MPGESTGLPDLFVSHRASQFDRIMDSVSISAIKRSQEPADCLNRISDSSNTISITLCRYEHRGDM
ncbi:hypothetical protein GPN2_11908 [Streptomyces murinus]